MVRNSGNNDIIRIETKSGKFAIESMRKAKLELENFFLHYLKHDGCIGRLFYDLALSCHNLHPRRGGSCVLQRDPWNPSEMGYVSIVDIPYVGNNWKTCHKQHLMGKEHRVLSRVKNAGCTVRIVDRAGRIKTKWVACKPYVWVWGERPGDVDAAVQILNDANKEHMNTCTCHLP